MGLSAHFQARIGVFAAGFFAAFGLFVFLIFDKRPDSFALTMLLFFGFVFGGGYLAQFAFTQLVPAVCPACGQRQAMATMNKPALYACRACGAESHAAEAMRREQIARLPTPQQAENQVRGVSWLFLVVGLGMTVVAAWLAQDSILLLREGVSTPAQVMRVASRATRDSDGKRETTYTAFIEYRVGNGVVTLERMWSVRDGSHCVWPCYDRGEMLKVIYLPAEPSHAEVRSLPALFFAPVLVGGIGLLFVMVGFFLWRRTRRPKLAP